MGMKRKQLKIEDLPEILSTKHFQEVLEMSRRGAYDFMENPPFHVARVERLYKVSKRVFLEWLEGESND
jgi:hypothetical protein